MSYRTKDLPSNPPTPKKPGATKPAESAEPKAEPKQARRSVTFFGDGTAEINGFPPGVPGLEQVLGFIDLNVKPDELKRTLIANSRRAAAAAAQGTRS